MKQTNPEGFADAVRVEAEINEKHAQQRFLHRSRKPLDQVTFDNEHQLALFENECEGVCGV